MNEHNENLKENILSVIESGKVKMRPKWHFALKTILLIVGTVLVAFAVLFLSSFIVFILRQSGVIFVPGLGGSGLGLFVRSLPWYLILLTIVFIIVLEFLVRKYSFGYGKPLFYSALVILLIAIFGGIILEMTPMHRGLYGYARNNRLPVAGSFYKNFGGTMKHGFMGEKMVVGTIIQATSSGYILQTQNSEQITVYFDSETHFPFGKEFSQGDTVVAIVGTSNNGLNIAEGIRKIDDQMRFPRRQRHMMPYRMNIRFN